MKGLQVRSGWVIQLGPESCDKRLTRDRGDLVPRQAEARGVRQESEDSGEPRGGDKEGSSLRAPEGAHPCPHPHPGPRAPRTRREPA